MNFLVSCPSGRVFKSFFDSYNIELAKLSGSPVWNPSPRNLSHSEALSLIRGCDAYFTSWGAPPLSEAMLDVSPKLRLLVHLGANPAPLISAAAVKRGVRVISGRDYYLFSAAEGSLTYILSALRDIPEYSHRLKYYGEWRHSWDANRGLFGKTVGIVNYSPIASKLVRLLMSFNVRILIFDAVPLSREEANAFSLEEVSLEELLLTSDVICVYPSPRNDFFHLLNSSNLENIRDGALVVDNSSNGVLDKTALALAIRNQRFFAILDVCEEDLSECDEAFLNNENLTLMPHMAGPTTDIRQMITRNLLSEAADFIHQGSPLRNEYVIG